MNRRGRYQVREDERQEGGARQAIYTYHAVDSTQNPEPKERISRLDPEVKGNAPSILFHCRHGLSRHCLGVKGCGHLDLSGFITGVVCGDLLQAMPSVLR